jgi:hypothetical protein
MLSSPGNLRFWAALCGCSMRDADLAALLADFERAAAEGKPQLRRFCREWNADLLRKVRLDVLPAVLCNAAASILLLPSSKHDQTDRKDSHHAVCGVCTPPDSSMSVVNRCRSCLA